MMKSLRLVLAALLLILGGNTLVAQITIGTGTDESQAIPIEPFYGYTYSQSIYLQSEISASGSITTLSWYFSGTSNLGNTQDLVVYMGHTTKSSFSSTTDWVDTLSMTRVYSGTLGTPTAPGWIQITLDNSFTYNNTDNLVIAVDENTAGFNSSTDDFYCTSVSGNRSIYYRSDPTNPDPGAPPTATGTVSFIPNVIFGGITQACPPPTAFSATNITTTGANIAWNSGSSLSNVEYGPAGFTPGSGTTLTGVTSPQTLSNLTPATAYDVYIIDDCGSGSLSPALTGSFSTSIQTAVGVTCTTPGAGSATIFTEEFDNNNAGWTGDINSGNGSWEIPDDAGSSNTGADNAHSGANYMNYEASNTATNQGSIVSPAIDLSAAVNDAELSFWMHAYGATMGTLTVGVGTSASGPFTNVFTWSGQLQTSGSAPWQNVGINLASYVGQTIYIQFTQIDDQGSFYGDMSIDLVEVSACFTCVPPSAPSANVLSSTSAEVTWTPGLNETSWDVQWGPTGFVPGTGDSIIMGTNPDTITGLMPNTTYDYYVRANCGGTSGVSGWVGPTTFTTLCASQLSGTVTIDAGQPASATNFQSFTALANEINACGISGALTVNVAAGTYNEQVTFTDIVGASATNTITIDGGGVATISYDGAGTENATITLDGTDHITIQNLTIENTESVSNGWGVLLTNTADSVTIDNCVINIDMTSTSSTFAGVVSSNSTTSVASYANNSNHTVISNTTVNGGYYGIRLNGSTSAAGDNTGNTVENCTFNENRFYPIYFFYQDAPVARGNTTNLRAGVTSGYGIYVGSSKHPIVEGNYFNGAFTYGIYFTSVNTTTQSPTMRGVISNNMVTALSSGDGIYLTSTSDVDVFHNSVTAENDQALWLSSSTSGYDVRNNIFSASGSSQVVDLDAAPAATDVLNYNVYYHSGGGDIAIVGSSTYTDLAAWQVADATQNVNSLEGDPVFVSATDLHLLGALANNVGDNTVGITTDIDGDTRPATGTTVDIGADEYTPVTGDWALLAGMIAKSQCYNTSDTLMFYVQNNLGSTVDFSVNPLTLVWNVTGPVNSNGTINVNSGTLALGDTAIVTGVGANLSIPGNYVLNAYIDTNAVNQSPLNDTLAPVGSTISKLVTASPTTTTVTSTMDTVELNAFSPFFPNGGFTITEMCNFRTSSTGAPTGGWPSYMLAGDYIEITGSPGSDLGGYTLEQWDATSLLSSYTFPSGTVLSPSGTAIIAVGEIGSSQPSPGDFYYHGNGSYTGNGQSGGATGRILKDPQGNIEDAVGYSGSTTTAYTFPAAANVSAADWSNSLLGGSGSAGIRLEGADVNSGTNWVLSATSPQDPNTVNTNVTVPSSPPVSGFTWSFNGSTIDTALTIMVGPYGANNNGTYKYVAAYNSADCGLIYDTATVVVNIPCGVVTAPFFDGFETGNSYTGCWTQEQVVGTNSWTFATGSSGGAVTTANTGSLNARFTSSSGGPHITHLITPVIDASALTAPQLDFAYAQENWFGDQNFLNVYYRDSANGAWNLVFSDSTEQAAWTSAIVAIPSTSATLQIGFEGIDNYGRAVVVDDVMLDETPPSCPVTDVPSTMGQTSCGSNPVTFTATGNTQPNQSYFWVNPDSAIVALGDMYTTPPITATTDYYVGIGAINDAIAAQHVGPLPSIATSGFGNFTNGQWFTAQDFFYLDSITVRSDGALAFQVRISEPGAAGAGTELILSDTIFVTAAGDHQVQVGLPVAPGNYFMNVNFIGGFGTGQLFRATSGAVYPYSIAGLVSIDSVNFPGARYYYTYDWVINEVCTSTLATATATLGTLPSTAFPYAENFDSGLPCNWSTDDSGAEWMNVSDYNGNSLDSSNFMFIDDDAPGSGVITNSSLITPSFDTQGYDTLFMSFDHYFRAIGSTVGFVEVWDGMAWVAVDSFSTNTGAWFAPVTETYDLTMYQNTNLQVRFRYDDGGSWGWYWSVDNFAMDGTPTPCTNVVVDILTDTWGSETTWSIVDTATGTPYASGGPYPNSLIANYVDTICLPEGIWYEFRINDSFGDGLFDGTNTGTYSVDILCPWGNNNVISGSGAFPYGGPGGTAPSWDSTVFEVTCLVPCSDPDSLMAMAGCDDATLSWVSDTSAVSSTIQWGPAGFTPGTGTIVTNVTSPYTLTGLSLGTSYDFWVLDSCSSGSTSSYTGPVTFTTDTLPVVSASSTVTSVTGTDATVDFTATGTGTSYAWDFGDGNSGTGATPTHSYTANGTYTVVVTATNDCGNGYDTIQVVIAGIGLDEFGFGDISLYPNPNDGYFTISGLTEFGNDATLEVVTVTGTVVYNENIVANGSESFTIDVRGFAPGVYYVRVSSDKGVGSKPFVIRD
jgi:hypothetical protein